MISERERERECLIQLLIIIGHWYLSDIWLGMAPSTDTKKTCVWKRLDYVPQNEIIVVGLKVNMNGKDLYDHLMSMRIFILNIHMVEGDHGLNLDLPTISY